MFYRCGGCGGNVVYDPQKKKMVCESCMTESNFQVIEQASLDQCDNCGTILEAKPHTLSCKCPACSTYLILNDRMEGDLKPDLVLPFTVDKNSAIEKLRESFGKKLFLPGNFLNASTVEKMEGVYVPFWMFDFHSEVSYIGRGEKIRTWSDGDYEYTETKIYRIEREFEVDYDKIPADGSSTMEDKLMDLLEPYDYAELIDFKADYMSGFFADTYDEDSDKVQPRAEEKAKKYANQQLRSSISGYDNVIDQHNFQNHDVQAIKYAFLPVWRYVYTFQGQEYHFFVNGQSGKVSGAPPISKGKAAGLGVITFASVLFMVSMIINFLGVF